MNRKKRKQKRKPPHILIVTEGETEQLYFKEIKLDPEYKKRLSTVKIKIIIKEQASEKTAERIAEIVAKAARRDNPYHHVWWVFDHDNNPNRKTGYDAGKKKGFNIAFSAFAFEQWYLLHFIKSAKEFTDIGSLIKALQKHLPRYEKARQNDFQSLKNKLDIAYEYTEWLRNQKDEEVHITDINPYTDVDKLVKFLINLE